MDWSLALLSQGIESVIDSPNEDNDWSLLVAEPAAPEAVETIRLYEQENRRWPWRRQLVQSGPFIDWACLLWTMLVCGFYWVSAQRSGFPSLGIMDSAAVSAGEWWRLFTATWLHADLGHLATNVTIGTILLGLVMWRYGTGVGLLAFSLTGAGGNLLVWAVAPATHRSLGASGAVMGSLGLLAIQSFSLYRKSRKAARHLVAGVLGGTLLFVLLGLAPDTDVLAHLGGFVSGLALGSVMALGGRLARNGVINFLAGLAFGALILWPWALAFRAI